MEGGLSHLQYADDAVLLLENSEQNIAMTKFLLFGYEELLGMKINYNKSEVFAVGIDELEGDNIADTFNCKLGEWPMKYLGLPTGFNKLSKAQLSSPTEKIEKRLQTWKC